MWAVTRSRCDQVSVHLMLISDYNQTSIYSGTNFNNIYFLNNADALTQLTLTEIWTI